MFPKVIVFSREGCSFCTKAKNLLDDKGVENEIVSLEDDFNGDKARFRKEIEANMPNGVEFSTLPQIFMGKRYIGGYSDLVRVIGE